MRGTGSSRILAYLNKLSAEVPVVFPIHPRTRKNIEALGIEASFRDALRIVEPVRYREFITLEKNAGFILTDSGGIQEETTYLGLPCLTLRPNTERPITITEGTNELVDMSNIEEQSAQHPRRASGNRAKSRPCGTAGPPSGSRKVVIEYTSSKSR